MSTPYGQQPGPWGEQQGGGQWGGQPQQPQGYPQQAPTYPQQGYQPYQQGYQQPFQQPAYGQWAGGDRPRRQRAGIVGLGLAVVGAVLLIVGFTALDWYSGGGQGIKFSDFHDQLSKASAGDLPGLTKVYFGWLGWVLLALVVVCAIAANLPIGPATVTLRIITPVLGAAGIALTLFALNELWDQLNRAIDTANRAYPDAAAGHVGVFQHSAAGLYITLAGFLVAGVAGIFGPRRG